MSKKAKDVLSEIKSLPTPEIMTANSDVPNIVLDFTAGIMQKPAINLTSTAEL